MAGGVGAPRREPTGDDPAIAHVILEAFRVDYVLPAGPQPSSVNAEMDEKRVEELRSLRADGNPVGRIGAA